MTVGGDHGRSVVGASGSKLVPSGQGGSRSGPRGGEDFGVVKTSER